LFLTCLLKSLPLHYKFHNHLWLNLSYLFID
jgi:hypothetical protein